jgi:ubiquinone/menaquinone biosynthesis C-methylase UbiE
MTITTLIYKALYWYISTVDKKNEILFMNYGYHHENESLPLSSHDEINRYSIQLYHRMAQLTVITNKNIVEVGCGRGGGLAYFTRTFNPASALGIDLDAKAMNFAANHYNLPKLEFHQGNAMHLKLPDNSCDVLLNVESSHRYPLMGLFLDEVYRILRPGGYFLFTDFRPKHKFEAMKKMIAGKKFILKEEQIINKEVINALELDTPRRVELVERYAPLFLKKHIHDFAGNIGSPTYKKINSGDFVYFVYCFQKPE